MVVKTDVMVANIKENDLMFANISQKKLFTIQNSLAGTLTDPPPPPLLVSETKFPVHPWKSSRFGEVSFS